MRSRRIPRNRPTTNRPFNDVTASRLTPLLMLLVLLPGACDSRGAGSGQSSITVKLPPPKPRAPAPAFSFKAPQTQNAL